MAAKKSIDLVVLGATGFTGGLVAKYVAKNGKPGLRWAIAGRSESKLAKVRDSLKAVDGARDVGSIELLVCDTSNQAALDEVTARARVLLTTVGPFAQYGSGVVASCVKNNCDYIDSTGESPWVASMIEKHAEEAKANGTVIVPFCGFDSIPSDLGTFMMAKHIREQRNSGTASIKAAFSVKAGVSGGTIQSAFGMMDSGETKRLMNPYLLCDAHEYDGAKPEPKTAVTGKAMPTLLGYDKDLKTWLSPFVMANVNQAVVRRSAYLRSVRTEPSYRDSGAFDYKEHMGSSRFLPAFFTSMALSIFGFLSLFSICRRVLRKVLPKPGQGPSDAARAAAWFRARFAARSDESDPVMAFGEVSGGDPGYDETAKMLAECAFCCVDDRERIPGSDGGFLTPSLAFGDVLVDRLVAAGMKFSITQPAPMSKL